MSESHRIRYTPFPLTGTHIRTLTLCAGEVRDPIRCTLQVVDLDDHPTYDALSYTWGEPGVTEVIEVDGFEVKVTLNLEGALRHLRHTNKSDVLWVDAVCINQMNVEEKSQQVALMGQIYRKCSQVRIWLGCDAATCGLGQPILRIDSGMDDSAGKQDPFELVRRLAQGRHIHEWPCFKTDDAEEKIMFEENDAFNHMWVGFLTITKSTWWSRMWTVQEAILPKAGTMTYDTWSTSLEEITGCGTNYYDHVWDCCRQATASLPDVISVALDEFCTTFFTLDRDRNTLAAGEYFDIQDQHISYGRRQCQNPRDKVYGLLALIGNISHLEPWLTPNYSASAQEVFYDATCAMLYRDRRDLKCLTGAEYGPSNNQWASWVRDFAAPLTQTDADIESNRLMIYDLFDASSGRKANSEQFMAWPRLADENPHQVGLEITGKCVGTVASIFSEMIGDDSTEGVLQRRRIFAQWVEASLKVNSHGHCGVQQRSNSRERFWRTMLGGVASTGDNEDSDWRRFTHEALEWLESFLSWIETGNSQLDLALDRTITVAAHGRSYFQTRNGGHGLCYPTTQDEDEVWIVNGSKVPFILREIQLEDDERTELRNMDAYGRDDDGVYGIKAQFESEKTPAGYYELIGDCYFDGFMDGEAFREESLPEEFVVLV